MRALIAAACLTLAGCAGTPVSGPAPFIDVEARSHLAWTETVAVRRAQNTACTADGGWCAELDADVLRFSGAYLSEEVRAPLDGVFSPEDWMSDGGDGRLSATLYGGMIRINDPNAPDALVAVLASRTAMYSGGGGASMTLALVSARSGREVWRGVVDASKTIRACFSEADYQNNVSCSDQVRWTARLSIDPASYGAMPDLILTTQADAEPRIRAGRETYDIRTCSYVRRLVWVQNAGRYAPERPEPACEDFKTV